MIIRQRLGSHPWGCSSTYAGVRVICSSQAMDDSNRFANRDWFKRVGFALKDRRYMLISDRQRPAEPA